MLISLVPPLVFAAGLLVYALSSNSKVVEIGRAGLWVGLFWTVAALAHKAVHVFS